MSGDPILRRAKRIKFVHTSHITTFTGAETEEVAGNKTENIVGNKTASIDGDYTEKVIGAKTLEAASYSIDAPLDLKNNKLLHPRNILRTEKFIITHADLVGTASQFIDLMLASPGDTIVNVVGKVTAAFGQAASLDQGLGIEVGDPSDFNGFAVSHEASPIGWIWDAETVYEKGVYIFNATPWWRKNKTYTASTQLRAVFTGSDIYVASYERGAIEIYIDIMSRS